MYKLKCFYEHDLLWDSLLSCRTHPHYFPSPLMQVRDPLRDMKVGPAGFLRMGSLYANLSLLVVEHTF